MGCCLMAGPGVAESHGGDERVTQGRGRAPRLGHSRPRILRGTGGPQRSCRSKGGGGGAKGGGLRGPMGQGCGQAGGWGLRERANGERGRGLRAALLEPRRHEEGGR